MGRHTTPTYAQRVLIKADKAARKEVEGLDFTLVEANLSRVEFAVKRADAVLFQSKALLLWEDMLAVLQQQLVPFPSSNPYVEAFQSRIKRARNKVYLLGHIVQHR